MYHDAVIEPNARTVKRWLNKVGENRFEQLLKIRMADILAHTKGTQQSRIDRCVRLGDVLVEVLQSEQCFQMKDLAISGKDILSLGVPQGRIIGDVLRHILDHVINGDILNELGVQMVEASTYLAEHGNERTV